MAGIVFAVIPSRRNFQGHWHREARDLLFSAAATDLLEYFLTLSSRGSSTACLHAVEQRGIRFPVLRVPHLRILKVGLATPGSGRR
jgi:hypothetical protein